MMNVARSTTVSEMEEEINNLSFTSHLSVAFGPAAYVETMAMAENEEQFPPMEELSPEDASPTEEETTAEIAIRFIRTGFPLTISFLSIFSFKTVIIACVGSMLGEAELGAVSLALGLLNATGFAFGAGLCGALETVLSHCYGSHKRAFKRQQMERAAYVAAHPDEVVPEVVEGPLYLYGIYAQRMGLILLGIAVPLGVVVAFIDSIMNALGGNPVIVYYTGQWCHIALFGVPVALYQQLLNRYYSCQHMTVPPSIVTVGGALLNPVLQFTCIRLFGFRGSAIAWLLLILIVNGSLTLYISMSGLYKKTWNGFSGEATRNVGKLFRIALPSLGVMLSEWVALEINALAGAFDNTVNLAAYSISLQMFGVMFGIGAGVMIMTCVFVGNAIGSGKPLLARKTAFIAIGLVVCISFVDIALAYLLSPFIPRLFSDSAEVAEVYHDLMKVVMPYHTLDILQSTVMGVLRGCGLQKVGAIVTAIAFCVVGVPLSFLLFFYFDYGIISLWIGPAAGAALVGLPSYAFLLLYYIDWASLKPVEENTGS
ncbi:MatE, putative [Angomonas deanei]|uniref:MatE, putative n=1 Tax=Angomonas deanei TaxID=59799 RepID=A0A7G2C6G7_9TRYP|nr:MatE, putative [Angomonas deanei]